MLGAATVRSATLGAVGILLTIILFVALQIVGDRLLRDSQIDLTEDRSFTLSEGTERVLARIGEPILLRFYLSTDLSQASPLYGDHAKRVRELLERYVRLAEGKLILEVFEPEAFSPEEDQAQGDGLSALQLAGGGQAYFGLAAFNATDDSDAIRIFEPARANFLEYDLTRLIQSLTEPEKPVVGLLGDLPLSGGPETGFQPWLMLQAMRSFFEVRTLDGETAEIGPEVDVLLLAQPRDLSDATRYAVDQYALQGRPILVLADPFSDYLMELERQQSGGLTPQGMTRPGEAVRSLQPLLESWGVALAPNRVVGDLAAAQPVQFNRGGRQVLTDYVLWLGLSREAFAADDVVTAELNDLKINSAGSLAPREDATTSFVPLVLSSPDSMLVDSVALQALPDPALLLAEFEADAQRHVLAARLRGPAESAFPDGPPAGAAEGAAQRHLARSEEGIDVIVVADSDLVDARVWTTGSGRATLPIADNADFFIGALDNLAGGSDLLDLRPAPRASRPFEAIEAIRREAEQRFRNREQALLNQIQQAEIELSELLAGGSQVDLEDAGAAAIATLRQQLLAAREELRAVQRAMQQEIDRVETLVKLGIIWAVPLLIGLLALLLALLRYRRRVRRAALQAQ